jgi:hypothetical protein
VSEPWVTIVKTILIYKSDLIVSMRRNRFAVEHLFRFIAIRGNFLSVSEGLDLLGVDDVGLSIYRLESTPPCLMVTSATLIHLVVEGNKAV